MLTWRNNNICTLRKFPSSGLYTANIRKENTDKTFSLSSSLTPSPYYLWKTKEDETNERRHSPTQFSSLSLPHFLILVTTFLRIRSKMGEWIYRKEILLYFPYPKCNNHPLASPLVVRYETTDFYWRKR